MPELFEIQAQHNTTANSGAGAYYHTLPEAQHSERLAARGGLKETIEVIAQVTRTTLNQTKDLAKELYSIDPHTAASNVWHWTKANIKYHLDRPGSEQVRTPARSFADRTDGVDCEDMAIFTASLLLNMGYKPHFAIVAFHGKSHYGHIYTMLGNTVVDCVWTRFNQHPPGVTKTLNHNPMDIKVLSGTTADCINGLAAIAPPTPTTTKVLQGQAQLLAKHKQASGAERQQLAREIRKTHYVVNLNGSEYQSKMLNVMPALQDVTAEGEFVFHDDANLEDIADYLNDTTSNYTYVPELNGLSGNWLTNTLDKFGGAAKKVIDKVKKPLLKVMPIAVLARNAFLLLVKLNVRNIAKGFSVGYYTAAEAQAKGIPANVYNRCVEGAKKMEAKFENFGGKADNFRKQVQIGKTKKALFGKSKSTRSLKGWGNDMPHYEGSSHSQGYNMPSSATNGYYNATHSQTINGYLGEVATLASITAAIAAAAPLLIAVSNLMKTMKPAEAGSEYDTEGAEALDNLTADELGSEGLDAFAKELPNTPDPLADDQGDGKILGMPPVVALGGAAGLIYLIAK